MLLQATTSAAAAPAAQAAVEQKSMLELLMAGGPIMVPIAILFVWQYMFLWSDLLQFVKPCKMKIIFFLH